MDATHEAALSVAADPQEEHERNLEAFLSELRLLAHEPERRCNANVHGLPPALFQREDVVNVGVREHDGRNFYFHGDYVAGDFTISLFSENFTPWSIKTDERA